MNKPTILLSGSAGFIGINFVKYVLPQYEDKYRFVSIDKLANRYNIHNIPSNHKFYLGDITDEKLVDRIFDIERPTYVMHLAASSFVCDSIESPNAFVMDNVFGTSVLLEASTKYKVKRFHFCSTDECYGQLTSLKDDGWSEESVSHPRNNYSATKFAAEGLVHAANQVKGLEYTISRSCNNIGFFQPDRNLFPKICLGLLKGRTIFLHDEGAPIREYINAIDHARAMMLILERGEAGNTYNVGTGDEFSNLELVEIVSEHYGIKPTLDFTTVRAGQDFRYSVKSHKLRSLGWKPALFFSDTVKQSCEWYKDNLHLFDGK